MPSTRKVSSTSKGANCTTRTTKVRDYLTDFRSDKRADSGEQEVARGAAVCEGQLRTAERDAEGGEDELRRGDREAEGGARLENVRLFATTGLIERS